MGATTVATVAGFIDISTMQQRDVALCLRSTGRCRWGGGRTRSRSAASSLSARPRRNPSIQVPRRTAPRSESASEEKRHYWTSPVATGGALVGLAPQIEMTLQLGGLSPPNWDDTTTWWNFRQIWMSTPLHERKAPPAQTRSPPIDDFLATVLYWTPRWLPAGREVWMMLLAGHWKAERAGFNKRERNKLNARKK